MSSLRFTNMVALLLIIQPNNIYATTVCQDTKECTGQDMTESDKIYCASYYSCSNAIMNADSVFCQGNFGCKDAQIITEDTTNCVGHRSCYSSDIKSSNNIYCDGKYVCQYAKLSAENIYIYGDYGANYAEIDSNDLQMINIYSTGHLSGNNVNIYCRSGSICNLYCYGSGCLNTNYFCFQNSKCLFNCNEANHCPMIYDNDDMEDEDLNVIVDTKKKEKEKYKLQQQAKLQIIEQEMLENSRGSIKKNENLITASTDRATLQSTFIVIGELIIYSFVIMIVTYYCCYIKKQHKDFNLLSTPLFRSIGHKEFEDEDDMEVYLK